MTVLDEVYPCEGERAMRVDIGFSIESSGGSAFSFTMKDFGGINVHRPHPDSTLQTYHLRNIGTHMEKQFGWQRQNFRGCMIGLEHGRPI
jgi:hypothetical protein